MQYVTLTEARGRRARATRSNQVAHNHTAWWIKHPDPEGLFAKWTWAIRWISEGILIWLLCQARYDGLLFLNDNEDRVVGHIYCQAHSIRPWQHGLHLFAIWRHEDEKGTDLSLSMLDEFFLLAWRRGWRRTRLGTNRNEKMVALRERYFAARRNLPFQVIPGDNGWVTLVA